MDPSVLDFAKTIAPSGVYLVGLVYALKHIAALYQSRHEVITAAHSALVQAINDGHEQRLQAVEASAQECRNDRDILRKESLALRAELDQVRCRLDAPPAE